MLADHRHEVRRGHERLVARATVAFDEQRYLLVPSGRDRLHEPAAGDRIERRRVGQPARAVPDDDRAVPDRARRRFCRALSARSGKRSMLHTSPVSMARSAV
jgi:hypothetical protein